MTTDTLPLLPDLSDAATRAIEEASLIGEPRRKALLDLGSYVSNQLGQGRIPKITFICTHNSRRSHLSQIWAQTAACAYGFPQVRTYSGGTEKTAFFPTAVRALQEDGFAISRVGDEHNAPYRIRFGPAFEPLACFSKVHDHVENPREAYAAVMTCSGADAACPAMCGCDFRTTILYDDPKVFDGSPQEIHKYVERSRQIAREMFWLFSQVAKQ